MPHNVKILSARRGYEFRADDIRLTMLSLDPLVQLIQETFRFQSVTRGTPPATFGAVVPSQPPGIIFQTGIWITEENQFVPIRSINCEPKRIVIDIAGPSSHISDIYSALTGAVRQAKAPDGSQVLGEHQRILEFSEISAEFDADLDAWLPPSLRELFRDALALNKGSEDLSLIPIFTAQAVSPQEEYLGSAVAVDSRFLQFALRAGAKPSERIFFSSAPLDTEAHMNYLSALEHVLPSISAAIR